MFAMDPGVVAVNVQPFSRGKRRNVSENRVIVLFATVKSKATTPVLLVLAAPDAPVPRHVPLNDDEDEDDEGAVVDLPPHPETTTKATTRNCH